MSSSRVLRMSETLTIHYSTFYDLHINRFVHVDTNNQPCIFLNALQMHTNYVNVAELVHNAIHYPVI